MSNEESLYIIVSEGPNKEWIRKDAGPITRWWKSPGARNRTSRWIDEKINPMRWISEKVSPEYSGELDVLRDVHREVETWTNDLSNALDRALDAKKLGKPLDCIFWLGQINNRLKLVSDEKEKLVNVKDRFLDKYFEEADQDIPDDYFETGKHKIVEAGVFNDLGRQISTWRFEKSHEKFLMEQSRALIGLLNLAKTTVAGTYSYLNKMSKALGRGDISEYVSILEKIGQLQSKFQDKFRSVYNTHFAAMVEKIKERKKIEQERSARIKDEADQRERDRLEKLNKPLVDPIVDPIGNVTDPIKSIIEPIADPTIEPKIKLVNPIAEVPDSKLIEEPKELVESKPAKESVKEPVKIKEPKEYVLPPTPGARDSKWRRLKKKKENPIVDPVARKEKLKKLQEEAEQQLKSEKSSTASVQEAVLKNNHIKFHRELEKASVKNDPYLLAAMMLKYSEMIDETDPEKSLQLLAIAEGILNE